MTLNIKSWYKFQYIWKPRVQGFNMSQIKETFEARRAQLLAAHKSHIMASKAAPQIIEDAPQAATQDDHPSNPSKIPSIACKWSSLWGNLDTFLMLLMRHHPIAGFVVRSIYSYIAHKEHSEQREMSSEEKFKSAFSQLSTVKDHKVRAAIHKMSDALHQKSAKTKLDAHLQHRHEHGHTKLPPAPSKPTTTQSLHARMQHVIGELSHSTSGIGEIMTASAAISPVVSTTMMLSGGVQQHQSSPQAMTATLAEKKPTPNPEEDSIISQKKPRPVLT